MMRLIDADVLINRIVFHTDFKTDVKELFEDEINAEPTIEPVDIFTMLSDEEKQQNKWWGQGYIDALAERKKGKWLASDDMYETGICSCCRWDSQEPFDYAIANFHFCPNCGADMREEND